MRFGAAAMIVACALPACGLFVSLDDLSDAPASSDGGSVGPEGVDAAFGGDASREDAPAAADGGRDPAETGTPTGAAYRAAVLADAPRSFFGLEEAQGNGCASLTATSAITCVYPSSGVTRGVPGVAGTKATRLEASTSALTLSGVDGDLAKPYSIELWVREEAIVADATILAFEVRNAGPRAGIHLFHDGSRALHSELWSAGALLAYGVAPSPLATSVWHHIVLVHATGPDKDQLYLDGGPVESLNLASGARPVLSIPVTISGFVGTVDEIAIYDTALSAARIAAHYAAN